MPSIQITLTAGDLCNPLRGRRVAGPALTAVLLASTLLAAPSGLRGQSGSERTPDPARAVPAEAVVNSLRESVTRAALRNDRELLLNLRRRAERAVAAHPDDSWIQHYLGYTLFRVGLAEMAEGGPNAADGTLKRAQEVLEASALEDSIPESFMLLSTTLGLRIGIDPGSRGARLAARAGSYDQVAGKIAPENPRVWLLRGLNSFHTPAQFGGGAEKARQLLEKAVVLFEKERVEPPAPAWGEAEAHAYLGQVHARQGRPEKARAAYRRALEIEPNYGWVEHELLPALQETGGTPDVSGADRPHLSMTAEK